MTNMISKTGLLIAISLVVLLSAVSANAQSTARFQVPFQFLMGEKVLPAGDYFVKIDSASGRIELLSWQGGARLSLSANVPHRTRAAADKASLVFHKYGNTHVLRQMWRAGSSWGYELPESKVEREMARLEKTYSTREIAPVGGGSN